MGQIVCEGHVCPSKSSAYKKSCWSDQARTLGHCPVLSIGSGKRNVPREYKHIRLTGQDLHHRVLRRYPDGMLRKWITKHR